jgi:hypothetical protein
MVHFVETCRVQLIGSLLSVCFLFEVFIFKNVLNTVDNIRVAKKGPLRGKKGTPTFMG